MVNDQVIVVMMPMEVEAVVVLIKDQRVEHQQEVIMVVIEIQIKLPT
jgi:hypothetical protein